MWLGGSSGSGLWKNDGEIAGSLLFYFKDGGGCCLNVKLKKVLCVALTLLLSVNTLFSCVVYADQGFDDLFISPTPTPKPPLVDIDKLPGWQAQQDDMVKLHAWFMSLFAGSAPVMKEWGASAAQAMQELFNKLLASDEIKTDGDNLYITQNGVDQVNNTVQESLHAFDGFWIVDAKSQESPAYRRIKYDMSDEQYNAFLNGINGYTTLVGDGTSCAVLDNNYFVYARSYTYSYSTYHVLAMYSVKDNQKETDHYLYWDSSKKTYSFVGSSKSFISLPFDYRESFDKLTAYVATLSEKAYGQPFKVFYSYDSLIKYLLNNQQRSYAPKLPNQVIKIPISVINNTPEINYNITTENKTETEIQNEYNQQLNNYITNLYPSPGDPTPTPTPIISDGEPTPTPRPDWGDGSVTPTPVPGADMTETNDWLKKIYELLEKFYNAYKEFTDKLSDYLDNNDAFFKKVSEYLEKYDGKLDQIIDALDKIAQGKDEGDEKGCQYDYKELSEFLTKLWNDSDKKFDDMIDLLEENNEYQEKMLSTLNSIKNILRAQSVMDTFKNRSKETANKAKEKFPTSVPWDIAMIVNAMDAEPEDPVFILPIKIERLGIDEEIKVDLSTGEWEKLAKACRYMLTVLFILFMIKLSMKLFSGKDDD